MQERVQLNISVTREQKLALQALAEGHGTSVTKLVLGLIEVPEAAAVVVEEIQGASPHSEDFVSGGGPVKAATADRAADVLVAGSSPAGPLGVIKSPADVPGAVEYVFKERENVYPRRDFAPYSKEQQTGKAQKKKLAQAEPVQSCRHGLLRCKVCGTG